MGRKPNVEPDSPLARIRKAWSERYGFIPTLKEIGEKFGRHQTAVGEWGRQALPEVILGIEIADRLNLTLDYLYLGRGPEKPEEAVNSVFARAAASITASWTEEEKARTLAYLAHKQLIMDTGLPHTVQEAVDQLNAETGRFRKPKLTS